MANVRYIPTIRRRRLSAELKRVRHAAQLTQADVARKTEIAETTISNIESGVKKRPKPIEVSAWLDACKVTAEGEREAILDLARNSHERGDRESLKSVLSARFITFETAAAVLSNWEPVVVPGLLQVASYMELQARAALERDPKQIQRSVDARLHRQKRLFEDDAPSATFVFDETALHRLSGHPQILHDQVTHLLQLAEGAGPIEIQMTRADRPNPGSAGSFLLMDFADVVDPSVVYLETDTDGLYLEDADEVARYRRLFTHLRLGALSSEETVDRLREMIT